MMGVVGVVGRIGLVSVVGVVSGEPTSPCPIIIMASAWLGSDKDQFESHWFDSTMENAL